MRPALSKRALPALSTNLACTTRAASNVPSEDPKQRAQAIIDSLPGNSLISKTAILSAGAGLSIAAISNEIYVVNEESIVMFSLLTVFWAAFKYGGPVYKEWAEGHIRRIKAILYAAREDHTQAVRDRIDDVKQLSGVVDLTKQLFEVSKETARLEAQAYELEQKTALAQEAKSVLDSWVRYEGQVKQRQQRELAESIISKIRKELENPKQLQQILQQSVADVESKPRRHCISGTLGIPANAVRYRDHLLEEPVDNHSFLVVFLCEALFVVTGRRLSLDHVYYPQANSIIDVPKPLHQSIILPLLPLPQHQTVPTTQRPTPETASPILAVIYSSAPSYDPTPRSFPEASRHPPPLGRVSQYSPTGCPIVVDRRLSLPVSESRVHVRMNSICLG